MSRLFHHGKELAAGRAAEAAGTFYSLSTLGTTPLEDIAAAITSPNMFKIYILKDRGLTLEFVQRCKAAGYQALCLTVDMAMAGYRERDLRTGMVMPLRFGLKSLWSFATHPVWAMNLALHPGFKLANVAHRVDALSDGSTTRSRSPISRSDATAWNPKITTPLRSPNRLRCASVTTVSHHSAALRRRLLMGSGPSRSEGLTSDIACGGSGMKSTV